MTSSLDLLPLFKQDFLFGRRGKIKIVGDNHGGAAGKPSGKIYQGKPVTALFQGDIPGDLPMPFGGSHGATDVFQPHIVNPDLKLSGGFRQMPIFGTDKHPVISRFPDFKAGNGILHRNTRRFTCQKIALSHFSNKLGFQLPLPGDLKFRRVNPNGLHMPPPAQI